MGDETGKLVPLDGDLLSTREGSATPALPTTDELAMQVIQIMDIIAERMELQSPDPSTAKRVRGARTVSRDFVVALTALVESTPELQNVGPFRAAEAREVLEARDGYRQVAERTSRLLASMNYTIEARWAKVVTRAMFTLTVATMRAESTGNADLAARVENIRKLLGRKGMKKKASRKKDTSEE